MKHFWIDRDLSKFYKFYNLHPFENISFHLSPKNFFRFSFRHFSLFGFSLSKTFQIKIFKILILINGISIYSSIYCVKFTVLDDINHKWLFAQHNIGSRHTKLWVNPVIQSPINFNSFLIAGNITWSAKAEHQSWCEGLEGTIYKGGGLDITI